MGGVNERADELRKQMLELWKKTVGQMEEISHTLLKTANLERWKVEGAKLIEERDRLLKRMGEETFKLIDTGSIQVPRPVQDLYRRLRSLMDQFILREAMPKAARKPVRKAARKPARKKTPAKTPAK